MRELELDWDGRDTVTVSPRIFETIQTMLRNAGAQPNDGGPPPTLVVLKRLIDAGYHLDRASKLVIVAKRENEATPAYQVHDG